LRSFQYFQL